VSYEHGARQFIVNALGRELLNEARKGRFEQHPLLVFVDEAHNFLGRSIGVDESKINLDAFELIAREGRKYGLNVCLATQRPRDLTEGVLSQIGTLIVHRLTNDRDREIVERACGEIDRSASAFLASLRAGEAAIIGVDFPIPLTVQVAPPTMPPASDGPDYQRTWGARTGD
jgi:DNA helicase HerA-like ATPase